VPGLGKRRTVGVVLHEHRAAEAIAQQLAGAEAPPGLGQARRLEERGALAVERPRHRHGNRLELGAGSHPVDERRQLRRGIRGHGGDPHRLAQVPAGSRRRGELRAADVDERDHQPMMPTLAAMLLAIDVGNTNIVVGVFEGERLKADFRTHTDDRWTGDELGLLLVQLLSQHDISPEMIQAVVVSNVVPTLTSTIDELSHSHFKHRPMLVGPGMRSGVRIHYEDPRQVGADRIANAVAARALYGAPAIMVDFGTATTLDAIDEHGEYLGGAIAPGIQISHDALVSHAARLARVELTPPENAIGRTTATSMQSGLVFGYVGLVTELVRRIRQEMGGTATVIATGGMATRLATLIDVIDVIDERLTLTGLRLIHDMNA
jgi:type III pantothenate kinase